MGDDSLRALATAAGISVEWTDARGERRLVSPETLRAMLAAMAVDCGGDAEVAESRRRISDELTYGSAPPPLITAEAGSLVRLPFQAPEGARALIEFELGGSLEAPIEIDAHGAFLKPVSRQGYHRLLVGDRAATLAVAPRQCWTMGDVAPGARLWGLTAQIHALRRGQDGGIGDFGAVADLASSAARHGADTLSLSPTHALFAADDNHFTPYSPSSRLFHNVLLADPAATFDAARVSRARERCAATGELAQLESLDLIDWPRAARARKAMLRVLFDSFRECELTKPAHPLAVDFARFKAAGGAALELHATFEALHAKQFSRDHTKWHWRSWPAELRDKASPIVKGFAASNAPEVGLHIFSQWLAERSLARAQGAALAAGMRVGLVSDIAVGMNDGGSQAWSNPNDLLLGLSIGAPPDPLAPRGQNWGLTTFAPRALAAAGYAPFIATLRAALRHAGGVRIDHVMGLSRLWLTPDGMESADGAYLAYPETDLLRLIALESRRHRAIVIGEDLGVVPYGLRERLAAAGAQGIRVLQFERHHGGFNPPEWYPANAAATTSTHDTATMAGWWNGADLTARARLAQLPPGQSLESAALERDADRISLWTALRTANATAQDAPPPPNEPAAAVDAAVAFLARAPANLALLPLDDALCLLEQPNLPGTINEYPNWRRRYPGNAKDCLDQPAVERRLRPMVERR